MIHWEWLFGAIFIYLFSYFAPSEMLKKDIIAKFWFWNLSPQQLVNGEIYVRNAIAYLAGFIFVTFIVDAIIELKKRERSNA